MRLKLLNRFAFLVFFAFAFNFVAFAGLEDEKNEKKEKKEKEKEKETIISGRMEENENEKEKEKEKDDEYESFNYIPSLPSQNNQSTYQELDNNGNFLRNEQESSAVGNSTNILNFVSKETDESSSKIEKDDIKTMFSQMQLMWNEIKSMHSSYSNQNKNSQIPSKNKSSSKKLDNNGNFLRNEQESFNNENSTNNLNQNILSQPIDQSSLNIEIEKDDIKKRIDIEKLIQNFDNYLKQNKNNETPINININNEILTKSSGINISIKIKNKDALDKKTLNIVSNFLKEIKNSKIDGINFSKKVYDLFKNGYYLNIDSLNQDIKKTIDGMFTILFPNNSYKDIENTINLEVNSSKEKIGKLKKIIVDFANKHDLDSNEISKFYVIFNIWLSGEFDFTYEHDFLKDIISRITHLKCKSDISKEKFKELKKFENLTDLDLSNCQNFTNDCIPWILNLKKLKILNLNECKKIKRDKMIIPLLCSMENLEELSIFSKNFKREKFKNHEDEIENEIRKEIKKQIKKDGKFSFIQEGWLDQDTLSKTTAQKNKTLIKSESVNELIFDVTKYLSVTGAIVGSSRVAKNGTHKAYYIICGPYISLKKGKYEVEFSFKSSSGTLDVIGYADVYFNISNGYVHLRIIEIHGTENKKRKKILEFECLESDQDKLFEFRIYWNGNSDLEVYDIILRKKDDI